MQKKELNSLNHKLIDKVIKVAYGDAGIFDWMLIRFKSINNNEIKLLLEEYKNTARAVHKIKQDEAPQRIFERIKIVTAGPNKKDSIFTGITYGILSFFGNKPIPATIMVVATIIVVSFFVLRDQPSSNKYSKAEIELAQKQFKQSLAIVGRTFQKAEKSFNKEVLKDQINKNLNRGYYLVNNILIGG